MMKANEKQIRIIKRAERSAPQTAPPEHSRIDVQNSGARAERDAAAAVTNWVRELRRKKVAETTRRFESLFDKAA